MKIQSKKSQLESTGSLLARRVVKDQDKASKKIALIQIASDILNTVDYHDLSIDMLAKQSGLAKGTWYLYFKTKEEIALAVLKQEYLLWFNDFCGAINTEIKEKSDCSLWIVNSLKPRTRFLKLIPLGPSLLENKVSEDAVSAYKLDTYKGFVDTVLKLSTFFHRDEKTCAILLTKIHIAVVGSLAHGFQTPTVKKIIKDYHLYEFDTDYFQVLHLALEDVFALI